ncbi:MAG TPA: hypothetical protein VGO46_17865 [Gemmatimonadaceae bacterium]|nr:hypothetical protein [Gemmatimonadaceae bacterium]
MMPIARRSRFARIATVTCALSLANGAAFSMRAQVADSARVGISPVTDSSTAPAIVRSASDSIMDHRDSVLLKGPPIRPKTALLRSLLVPGWGQASLDRGTAGATYFALEAGSIAMLIFAKNELRVAKRAARDSTFVDDSTLGAPPELAGRVRLRRLQVEDWAALIFFTHLFSAADAFVSAHLWDVRVQVRGGQEMRSGAISATIPF